MISKKLNMNPDNVIKWVRRFAAHYPGYLPALIESAEKKDFQEITKITYKIKSASALLGIFDLMDLADKIYQKAHVKADIDYRALITEIKQAFAFLKTI